MKTAFRFFWIACLSLLVVVAVSKAQGRRGSLDEGSIVRQFLVSNGPKGPIHGGESAVTDMVLMADGWVYGSTGATWGAKTCHLFRTDGEKAEPLLNVTQSLSGQTKVSDLAVGPDGTLVGATTTYNEVFDDPSRRYEGGHLFTFDPKTGAFADYGIIAAGQGINCLAVGFRPCPHLRGDLSRRAPGRL